MTHLRVMEFGCFIDRSDDFDMPAPWQAIGSIARRLLAEIAAPRFACATRGAGEESGPSRAQPAAEDRDEAAGERMEAADAPADVRRLSAGNGWARPSEMGSARAGGTRSRAPGLGGYWKPRRARQPWEVDPADEGVD
ncbi:hypothetical protein STAQ_27950 [Allostella sp. ATCC 35155]|nr:hypothetical protein STAQ_27950 [Stella sp. ATCC 35155]